MFGEVEIGDFAQRFTSNGVVSACGGFFVREAAEFPEDSANANFGVPAFSVLGLAHAFVARRESGLRALPPGGLDL